MDSNNTPVKKRSHKGFVVILLLIILADILVFHILSTTQASAVSADKTKEADTNLTASQKNSLALDATWKSLLTSFKGSVDIALYNHNTGETSHYTNYGKTFDTASIIKMSILEETLIQDQNADLGGLTDSQLAEATPMIENSDNDAASALWDADGGVTAMTGFFKQLGTSDTTPNTDWGLTQTTALDQLKVVNALAYPGKILTTDSTSAADGLLDQVEADQTWGVSGGVPSDISFELKDGWLPDDETNDQYSNTYDWTVNSIGHVYGKGVDYTIAVLTDGDASEQAGITTIESLSTAAWNNMAAEAK